VTSQQMKASSNNSPEKAQRKNKSKAKDTAAVQESVPEYKYAEDPEMKRMMTALKLGANRAADGAESTAAAAAANAAKMLRAKRSGDGKLQLGVLDDIANAHDPFRACGGQGSIGFDVLQGMSSGPKIEVKQGPQWFEEKELGTGKKTTLPLKNGGTVLGYLVDQDGYLSDEQMKQNVGEDLLLQHRL
jgi:hypothetical protein